MWEIMKTIHKNNRSQTSKEKVNFKSAIMYGLEEEAENGKQNW